MTKFRKPCGWGNWDRTDVRPPLTPWLQGEIVTHSQGYWSKIHWATPPWVNCDELWAEMRAIYESANSTFHQVDHIVPLSHPYVCGLNVPWNLAVICKNENQKKSNDNPYDPQTIDLAPMWEVVNPKQYELF